jgi:O-antigen ligase
MLQAGLLIAALGIGLFVGFVTYRDNWLLFAPNYERTVTHTRFDNLLEATTRLEDISLMERVYRWVAAAYMIEQKPILGFGPGTFYFNYRNFTVTSFKTYVSHNPERSGIHNYYLMVAVEQGLPGLFFFLAFCVLVLLWGQRTYHRLRDVAQGRFVMAASLSFALICLLMFMNDFVETDKIGSLFFICAAIVVNGSLSAEVRKQTPGS